MTPAAPRWDPIVRLCHWAIVVLVLLQFATGQFGWLDLEWHFWFGYALLTVLGLRLIWGFAGPASARFTASLHPPSALIDYVRNFRSRKGTDYVAHNPLGALSVFVLWFLLLAQGVTGLITSDDIMNDGPLLAWFPEWERFGSRWHHLLKDGLLIFVGLHVLAIVLYALIKKEHLIGAMVHGRRAPKAEETPSVPDVPPP